MSDYMAQKADNQIQAGLNERDLLIDKLDKVTKALEGILEIGKRDMSNPKYDGYFQTAEQAVKYAKEG